MVIQSEETLSDLHSQWITVDLDNIDWAAHCSWKLPDSHLGYNVFAVFSA